MKGGGGDMKAGIKGDKGRVEDKRRGGREGGGGSHRRGERMKGETGRRFLLS